MPNGALSATQVSLIEEVSMKELSIETIERWLKDTDWRVRAAAMTACQGKDVPLEEARRY